MATPLLSRLGLLAAKVEADKGVAETLAAADATFRVLNLKYTPDVKIAERNTLRADLSRNSHLVGQTLGKIEFDLEFKVSATNGVADAYGDLFEACGLNEALTGTPGTNGVVTYNPSSRISEHATLTMAVWMNGSYDTSGTPGVKGTRISMRGAMGNVRFSGKVGEPLMMHFEFMGVSDRDDGVMEPAVTAFLTGITYEAGVPPIFQGGTFTWNGNAVNLTNDFTLDAGTQVVAREDIQSQEGVLHYMVTGRSVTGSFSPEVHASGGQNHLQQLNLGSEVAVSLVLTHASGRTATFAIPKAQLTNVQSGDRNGIATFACTFAANVSSAGDDEFTLAVI